MNTIHDLGGMDGFTLSLDGGEAVFKEDWERELWGLIMTVWYSGIPDYPGGTRADIERIPPERYLDLPYYAKWLEAEEVAVTRAGVATTEELADPEGPVSTPDYPGFTPLTAADMRRFLPGDDSFERPATTAPVFSVGDAVVVKNEHPAGHTRVPRYTRGRRGTIQAHHGAHVLLDDLPDGVSAGPQHLYTVVFAAQELWGERGHPRDRISAELWEMHIEATD